MRYRSLPSITAATLFVFVGGAAWAQQHELGTVSFPTSCNERAQEHIQSGVAQLHHMMYEQARPHFQTAAKADASCAMAHWGVAMTSFQPLWHPTSDENLARGKAAAAQARTLGAPTAREAGYIAAVDAFFTDPDPPAPDRPSDHEARVNAWMEAQRQLHERHRDDVDAAAFHALAQVAYAMTQFSPDEEHDYARERQAGALLEGYLEKHPEHPGLHHYLIHAYDSPELAHKAEKVARAYDDLAPETPHALHMPSHIFVRLGEWEETIDQNERSAAAARRQMEIDPHAVLHYVHALDYVMYGYLQTGDEQKAGETLARVRAVEHAHPVSAYAYGLAAPQARYYLEQRKWKKAAALEPRQPDIVAWEDFPAAEALFFYARGLGAARSGDLPRAEAERDRIKTAVATLREEGDDYWAYMTEALASAVNAWILYERGDTERALALMRKAADLEDSMDKHPITPGEVLPVRELYGELLLREGRMKEARIAFETSLERTPNRRNALAGLEKAGRADASGG
jgi:tetratricopeptide (TPR) repeat protein